MRRRAALTLALLAATVAAATAIAVAQTGFTTPVVVDYAPAAGGVYSGVRPTAVGLPAIGESGTIGAGEISATLRAYHDSGQYDKDLKAVGDAARSYLDKRLAGVAGTRTCTNSYVRVRAKPRHRRLYHRVRHCRLVGAVRPAKKPAIVLDIDETSLSNYSGLVAANFSSAGSVEPSATSTGTAIQPTVDLYDDARQHGVAVFFITGRPSAIDGPTQQNLKAVGYDKGWDGLQYKTSDLGTEAFKSRARAAIIAKGYDIVLNLGDQESDLDGQNADRDFKYPNPFYFIGD